MEEDWELLELTGPIAASTVHSSSESLIYSLGSVVVVWDVKTDHKVNLRSHESTVTGVSISPDQRYLVTAEGGSAPVLVLWSWPDLAQIGCYWLPPKARSASVRHVSCAFQGSFILVLEHEHPGGYRASLWSIKSGELQMRQCEDVEPSGRVVDCGLLTDCFYVAEERCLKLWSTSSPFMITKRIHVKSGILGTTYSSASGVFLLLLTSGTLLVVNRKGKALGSVTHPRYKFSALTTFQDYLYLGSTSGSVSVYSLTSLKLLKDLPAAYEVAITRVHASGGSTLYALYADSTVQVLDVLKAQVINQSSGHSGSILNVTWLEHFHFASCSSEGLLYLWSNAGAGWNMQAMDLATNGKLTCVAGHPTQSMIACGFSSGHVKLFDVTTTMPRALLTVVLHTKPVRHLEFSSGYLGVSYVTGVAVLVELASKELKMTLEDASVTNQKILFIEPPGTMELSTVSLHDPSSLQLQLFSKDEGLTLNSGGLLRVTGKITDFAVHSSYEYVLATSDAGGIFIFSVSSGDICGVIEVERGAVGCYVDKSGLYVSIVVSTPEVSRVDVFEVGTGRKCSSLGRLAANFNPGACQLTGDGRFMLVGSYSGVLSVWRLPANLTGNILDMLENLQHNPEYWLQFPINLPHKGIKRNEPAESPSYRESPVRSSRAFRESVISLIKRPEPKLGRSLETPIRVSRKEPVFSRRSQPPQQTTPGSQYYSKPIVLKATSRYPSAEDLDINCEEPVHNPAMTLYETTRVSPMYGADPFSLE
jgi:WD40 repeat protein